VYLFMRDTKADSAMHRHEWRVRLCGAGKAARMAAEVLLCCFARRFDQ